MIAAYLVASALVTMWLCLLVRAGAQEDAARERAFAEAMEAEYER